MSQHLGDQIPGARDDEPDDKDRLPQGEQNRLPASIRLAAKNRRQQHHGYDGQILKDENPDRGSAMNRVAVPPFSQGL